MVKVLIGLGILTLVNAFLMIYSCNRNDGIAKEYEKGDNLKWIMTVICLLVFIGYGLYINSNCY